MYRRALASIPESRPRHQRGLTLIELMIALAIGLLIVAAMSVLLAGGSQSRREIEMSADVNENGRYALDVLSRELSQTGFYGSLVKPTAATTRIPADMPAATAMCLTGVANLDTWKDSLTYNVLGLGSAAGANIDADPSCIERKAGTDALFIQRASTCVVGAPNCPAESNADAYLQVSECGTEYSATPMVLGRGGTGSSTFALQTKTCAGTPAPKRKLIRRIYYVSAANALSYQDIPLSGALPAPVVLVENIEQLQIEYAFDTGTPADGTPDVFAAAPDPLAVPPTDWTQVIGVRIWLLARSSDPSRYTKNAASFVLGGDTTVSVAANSAGNPKRRAYSTYISFVTPKARSES
ncbi:PilW family protein [Variovorax paradoxus]|uniref:PilW family protein n=1 Tax=Variovorax paradoxus TaxID=34073 RepID=UPI003ECC2B54